jgi:hypothetical protein
MICITGFSDPDYEKLSPKVYHSKFRQKLKAES